MVERRTLHLPVLHVAVEALEPRARLLAVILDAEGRWHQEPWDDVRVVRACVEKEESLASIVIVMLAYLMEKRQERQNMSVNV